MRRFILNRAITALTLCAALASAGPTLAGGVASSTAPESTTCKWSGPPVGRRCESPAPRTAEAFKGQEAAAAIQLLGTPERVRSLSGGAQVLVWDRSGIALIDRGRVAKREDCQLQMAVTKSGRVTDTLLTADAGSCSKRFGLGG
jgi:hypothetical protein